MMIPFRLLCLAILMSLPLACTHTGNSKSSSSGNSKQAVAWNDNDAKTMAHDVAQAILSSPWLQKYAAKHGGKKPSVLLTTIADRTFDKIDLNSFTRLLIENLNKSGKIRVTMAKEAASAFTLSGSVQSEEYRMPAPKDAHKDAARPHAVRRKNFVVTASITDIATAEIQVAVKKEMKKVAPL